MSKPSRHIDKAIEVIDRMFPLENQRSKSCWKCQKSDAMSEKESKTGLCKQCRENLRD